MKASKGSPVGNELGVRVLSSLIAFACLTLLGFSHPGHLFAGVANGSFELGLSDWTATGVLVQGPPGNDPAGTDGTNAAIIGPFDTPNSAIAQTVNVQPGTTYLLRFASAASGGDVAGYTACCKWSWKRRGRPWLRNCSRTCRPHILREQMALLSAV